jgi:hypothetical protein
VNEKDAAVGKHQYQATIVISGEFARQQFHGKFALPLWTLCGEFASWKESINPSNYRAIEDFGNLRP